MKIYYSILVRAALFPNIVNQGTAQEKSPLLHPPKVSAEIKEMYSRYFSRRGSFGRAISYSKQLFF
ncbi:MAG: hypothetical protein ACK5LR_02845 [Mangrovibacterium sp.]